MKRELERVEVPGEAEARDRAWAVVRASFEGREPAERPTRRLRPVVAFAVVLALVAAALSSPGQAVIDELREVVGVERAQPALFSLPSSGRLLVASDAGVWVVNQDGSKRLLGDYREASWSPLGRFVVAAKQNELAALELDGDVRWTLARPRVRFPRWVGSATDTRIAYLASGALHIVAGDGTNDTDLTGLHTTVQLAPAWRPGKGFVLGFVDWRGRVHTFDSSTGRTAWPRRPFLSGRFPDTRKLVWSSDGQRLVLVRPSMLVVFGPTSAAPLFVRQMQGITDVAFEPGSHRLSVARGDDVLMLDTDRPKRPARRLFTGSGPFGALAWSPDGSWLLVPWPAADQWIFVRADGKRIRAVSNVSEQFHSRALPRLEGWCCER